MKILQLKDLKAEEKTLHLLKNLLFRLLFMQKLFLVSILSTLLSTVQGMESLEGSTNKRSRVPIFKQSLVIKLGSESRVGNFRKFIHSIKNNPQITNVEIDFGLNNQISFITNIEKYIKFYFRKRDRNKATLTFLNLGDLGKISFGLRAELYNDINKLQENGKYPQWFEEAHDIEEWKKLAKLIELKKAYPGLKIPGWCIN